MTTVDLAHKSVRELNAALHALPADRKGAWEIIHPMGKHAIAVGLNAPISVTIAGHVGYYCAGMNMQADVKIRGNAGVGLAENMMSGSVRISGDASQSAGATGHGGLLVVEGNAAGRCGISMKGVDIVVKGSVGPMSAFMGQAGNLVVLGDAGENLGDSLYEARLFVRGKVKSLGADCIEKPLEQAERLILKSLLAAAGMSDLARPDEFTFYGSARQLYHFHVDHADAY
jgi:methylamine---glutamate N-methyltransferase subunit B